MQEVLQMGIAGAAICAADKHAVSEQMSYQLLTETMRIARQQEENA